MKIKDVTKNVEVNYGLIYDPELVPLSRCACGTKFDQFEFTISVYPDNAYPCPKCGRRFYFSNTVRVYEVLDHG